MDYHIHLKELLNKIEDSSYIPRLLLHSCCGPCSSYCLSYLMEYFDITVFFYNPNIYPEAEYFHRLNEQKKIIDFLNNDDYLEYEINNKVIRKNRIADIKLLESDYNYSDFLDFISGYENQPEGGLRCRKCFELRLGKTASAARELNFDYFGTTLSVSPHKNAIWLNEIGQELDNSKFLISDFKKEEGYKTSIILSKQFDLYRQNYCGCEFSMWFDK